MKFNYLSNNFTSGEWSPKMKARSEVEQYFRAAERLENFIPQIYGGAFRRPGTVRGVLHATNAAKLQNALATGPDLGSVKSKLIPFVLSTGQKYFLCAIDGLPSTKWFMFDPEDLAAAPIAIQTNSYTDISASAASLKYTQVGDWLFIVDGAGVAPLRILHLNGSDFYLSMTFQMPSISSYNYWVGVPFLPIVANGSGVVLTPSGTTGAITIGASGAFFDNGHVGALFKFSAGGSTGLVFISGVTSPILASGSVVGGTSVTASGHGSAAGTSWEEAAWNDYRGWPRTITAFEGRVLAGGTKSYPDTLWGTRIGNVLEWMERPFEQDDYFDSYLEDNSRPFTLTPNSKEASNIRALSSDKTLLIHTDRSEIVGYGTQGALGPNDFSFPSSTSFGANTPMPVRANNYAVFVQKGGRKLRDVIFNYEQDQYKSTDLNFIADHLVIGPDDDDTGDYIVEICAATVDSSYVYVKTAQGRLLVLVLDRDYQINAWAKLKIGGSVSTDITTEGGPSVKSIGAIAGPTGRGDRIFLIVQRVVNGTSIIHLEYFDEPNENTDITLDTSLDTGDAAYAVMDHKTRYVKNSVDRAKSLDHLKGETVQIVANGFYLGEKVVNSSGEIDIDAKYESTDELVIVGLRCDAYIKTLPIEMGQSVPGSPQGFIKRVDQAIIKFYKSYGCQYGYSEETLDNIDFKDPNRAMNLPPQMFTGLKLVTMPTDYDREAAILIKQEKPFPCNILAVVSRAVLYD